MSVRPRLRGIGSSAGSSSASRAGRREHVGEPIVPAIVNGVTGRGDDATGDGAGTGDRDLLADDARTAVSNGSTLPGARRPGVLATSGASTGSSPSTASTATGSASRSSSRRTRCTAGARSRQSASVERAAPHVRLARPSRRTATPWPAAGRACGGSARRPTLDAGHRARAEERERALGRRTARASAARTRHRSGDRRASPPIDERRRQLARREREDLADGVVELADAAEAGGERDVGQSTSPSSRSARARSGPAARGRWRAGRRRARR